MPKLRGLSFPSKGVIGFPSELCCIEKWTKLSKKHLVLDTISLLTLFFLWLTYYYIAIGAVNKYISYEV